MSAGTADAVHPEGRPFPSEMVLSALDGMSDAQARDFLGSLLRIQPRKLRSLSLADVKALARAVVLP